MGLIEFNISKTEITIKKGALKQIVLHIKEEKEQVKLKIKEMKKKFKTFLNKTHLISQSMLKSKKKTMRWISVYFSNQENKTRLSTVNYQ